ncbi:MAG: hypothetical protein DWQ01_20580 [Planctomycetota bacterium]|nr:MAG: hypothetical protein DWQ01_20580 [Planctomycetota bacterium]
MPQPNWVPQGGSRDFRGDVANQLQAFSLGLFGHKLGHFFHHRSGAELNVFQFNSSGFDFRIIQNIIDDAEQVIAATSDRFHVVALFSRQLSGFQ